MSATILIIVSYLVSVIFCQDIGILPVEDTADWQLTLDELTEYREGWLASGITNYVYRLQASCFCEPCWIAAKYIVIEDGSPTYVEFDADALALDSYLTCNPVDHITSPLSNTFYDMTHLYDLAIAHAERGLAANCSDVYSDMICGGSVSYTYDLTYFYLTSVSLNYGPYVMDAGMSYTVSCLTPSADQASSASYSGTCDSFTMPSEGDTCGESGIDCAAQKCACTDCTDGSGESYGCCGCRLVTNTNGELMCSGAISQDIVCPDTISTCGGIAGITCADNLYCVDDPSDDCVDCGGVCVAAGDSCETSPDCAGLDCLCAECDDDSGNYYGCCGCIWQLNEKRDDVTCSGSISQEDVCPITTTEAPCICTMEYDPYCCAGALFSNKCNAACDGFDVDADDRCAAGECPPSCGGIAGIQCDDGLYCVDNPYDDCSLSMAVTGADCLGICASPGDICDCPSVSCDCVSCADDSGNSYGCCDQCTYQLNDDGSELFCSGYTAQDDVCPAEISTTTDDSASYCDDTKVAAKESNFDNDASSVGGFDYCKFCICREKGQPHCEEVAALWSEEDQVIVDLFNAVCDADDYEDLQTEDGEQCDFGDLRVKPAEALEACGCAALYCNGNPNYPDLSFGPGNGVDTKRIIVAIAFVAASLSFL